MWCSPSISSFTPSPYGSNRPAPGPAPAMRHYAPMAHPYKPRGSVYVDLALSLLMHMELTSKEIELLIDYWHLVHACHSCSVTIDLLMLMFRSNMEQPSTSVRQKEAVSMIRSAKNAPTNPAGFPPRVQQSMYRPQNPGHRQQFRQGPPSIPSPSRTSAPVAQTQDSSWMITSSFGTQRPALKEMTGTHQPRAKQQAKVQVED